ncbi:MAG: 4Fe-4S ferredoxin [Adlercreutzia equolifaciens]
MTGCGVAGLVVGGVLASWGVTTASIASGRIELRTTPTKMIVTDRARCSGCQRCEMMCTLKNDGATQESIARVRVWDNYNFGSGVDTNDGIFGNCQFTVASCKQCADPQCAKYCPVHAIHSDRGDRRPRRRCGRAHRLRHGALPPALGTCPTSTPQTGTSTKCISCGRCAERAVPPTAGIHGLSIGEDVAQKAIGRGGVVSRPPSSSA